MDPGRTYQVKIIVSDDGVLKTHQNEGLVNIEGVPLTQEYTCEIKTPGKIHI